MLKLLGGVFHIKIMTNLGYIKSYIILPTTVWGIPTRALVDDGIQNWQNSMVNFLLPPSLARGQGGTVGEGRNVWKIVEVNERAFHVLGPNKYSPD